MSLTVGIARPGYFSPDKWDMPTMQTNWINYNHITYHLKKTYGCKVVNIGFSRRSGADRLFIPLKTSELDPIPPTGFRHQTQYLITENIRAFDYRLLDGIDILIMPYYTFRTQRAVFYPLAHACGDLGIPLILWDTDANFIGQTGVKFSGLTLEQAKEKVWLDNVYVHEKMPRDPIENLRMRVLTPALSTPDYAHYFSFFQIFDETWDYNPEQKAFEVVYCGSLYRRGDRIRQYYDYPAYTSAIYGKYKEEYLEEFKWLNRYTFYMGHIARLDVQAALSGGNACVHIGRSIYNAIGHITPRVYETLQSGTLLLIDREITGGELVVGEQYVVSSPEDVEQWVYLSEKELNDHCANQRKSSFFTDATPEYATEEMYEHIVELLDGYDD